MARAERLLTLLQCLRRYKHPVSGLTLAGELGVSLRTVYRDIAALQAQGARIEGETGVGYLLRPGFTLPPLMFTEPEIEAIALGVQWVAQRGGSGLGNPARDALAKISSVLTPELRRKLSASTLLVGPGNAARVSDTVLDTLYAAIRQEEKILLQYRDGNGKESSRILWPFTLGFFDSVQLVVGWCELRHDFRSFRTDRICSVSLTGEAYPRRRNALFDEWRAAQGMLDK
ncbi:putative transcriptional regulator (Winged helix domain) [uncultured delta proteobacterium]|uniref:Putative transcriptional regulator (Winged helix domain) n=1 Tax=uncultured delta proteobacterium TaxID=34034 RepID=A0A212KG09_9DELT|nr:putative transcriptional regulator (Winged helix domain) [uncultured delta proteobacterium]